MQSDTEGASFERVYSVYADMLYRLAVAKSLLYSTELSVSEVAEQTGFGDVNNFIRYFKNDTGVTPLHYRKVIMNQTE